MNKELFNETQKLYDKCYAEVVKPYGKDAIFKLYAYLETYPEKLQEFKEIPNATDLTDWINDVFDRFEKIESGQFHRMQIGELALTDKDGLPVCDGEFRFEWNRMYEDMTSLIMTAHEAQRESINELEDRKLALEMAITSKGSEPRELASFLASEKSIDELWDYAGIQKSYREIYTRQRKNELLDDKISNIKNIMDVTNPNDSHSYKDISKLAAYMTVFPEKYESYKGMFESYCQVTDDKFKKTIMDTIHMTNKDVFEAIKIAEKFTEEKLAMLDIITPKYDYPYDSQDCNILETYENRDELLQLMDTAKNRCYNMYNIDHEKEQETYQKNEMVAKVESKLKDSNQYHYFMMNGDPRNPYENNKLCYIAAYLTQYPYTAKEYFEEKNVYKTLENSRNIIRQLYALNYMHSNNIKNSFLQSNERVMREMPQILKIADEINRDSLQKIHNYELAEKALLSSNTSDSVKKAFILNDMPEDKLWEKAKSIDKEEFIQQDKEECLKGNLFEINKRLEELEFVDDRSQEQIYMIAAYITEFPEKRQDILEQSAFNTDYNINCVLHMYETSEKMPEDDTHNIHKYEPMEFIGDKEFESKTMQVYENYDNLCKDIDKLYELYGGNQEQEQNQEYDVEEEEESL